MADKSIVQLEIQSLLDGSGFDQAKEELKKLGVNLEKTGNDGELSLSKIEKESKKTANSFFELGAKITVAYAAITKFMKASFEQAKADAQLRQAIKNNTDARSREGKTVSGLTKEYKDFAAAQQKVTGIGDEITQQLQTLLVSYGTAPSVVNRATAAIQDMSAATGKGTNEIANIFKKLNDSQVQNTEIISALREQGVKLNETNLAGLNVEQRRIVVLQQIENQFKGQAKVMADASGGVAQAEAAFGDFLETIGNVIVTGLKPFIEAFTAILSFFNSLSPAMSGMIVAVGGLTAAFLALNGAISLTPVGWVLTAGAAITGLVAALTSAEGAARDLAKENEEVAASLNKIIAADNLTKNNNELIKQLSSLKQGTIEYENLVKRLISTNPELAKSGVSVKNSYNDIKAAVDNLKIAQRQYRAEQLKVAISNAKAAAGYSGASVGGGFTLQGTPDESALNYYSLLREAGKSAADALDLVNKTLAEGRRASLRIQAGYSAEAQQNVTNMQITPVSLGGQGINQQAIEDMYRARITPVILPGDPAAGGGGGGSGSDETKAAIDIWQLRIDLMTDEFEKRKEMLAKQYNADVNMIREKLGEGATAELALNDLSLKYIKERADLEREEEQRLKEERIKAYNEALTIMQRGLSLGTSIIKKDWKSAISDTLSMIPGVGQTLSGVFGTAVDFFGEVFGSRSKTEAEKLGDWLEAAVQKFDQSFTRSETYSKLFGDLDLSAIEAEIDSISTALDESLAKIGLGAGTTRDQFKQYYDIIKSASFGGRDWRNYGGSENIFNQTMLSVLGGPRGGGLNAGQMSAYVENIRKLFRDVYGDASDEMLKAFGLTGTDRQIAQQWFNVKNQLDGINGSIIAIAENTATWYDKLEESQLKKGLASTKDELDRINKKYEIGQITQEEMVKKSSEQIDNALEYLRALEPTQEVLDAIDDLLLQQINLQKQLNDESAKGLDIEDEKLRNLLAQREELERNIAAGYVREGTSDTVSQQAAILRQIIARAKEIGLSRDDYFQYEEALANLMSGFAGSSYTGKTGFGYTPGVEDFVGNMPIGSSAFQTSMNTARAARSSTSNITTNTQNVTINGQAMVPNQEFVDGLRVLTKRVYGKDIIK